jgi:hypothetical protein
VKLQIVVGASDGLFFIFIFYFYFFILLEMTPYIQRENEPEELVLEELVPEDTAVIERWVPLKQDKDYEINDLSLKIRSVETKIEVPLFNCKDEYIIVRLGDRIYKYYRLIAETFIPNPDPLTKTCVDHIDRDKNNNTTENLHWVSPSENNLNRSFNHKYVSIFVKSLPVDARQLTHYKGSELKFQYFIANDSIYIKTETEFRQLNVMKEKYVHLRFKNDNNNHTTSLRLILNANAQ